MSRFFLLLATLVSLTTLGGCNVGPERSTVGGYTDSDYPGSVLEWTSNDDLTISGRGDPSALDVSAEGIVLGTEGPGTTLGLRPDGTLFAWSPTDVSMGDVEFVVGDDGVPRLSGIGTLSSTASVVREARAEFAAVVASQVVDLAEAERDTAVEALRVLESAGIPLAADVLRALVGAP